MKTKVVLSVLLATFLSGCATIEGTSKTTAGYDAAHAIAGNLGKEVLFGAGFLSSIFRSSPEMQCKNCEIADAKAKAEAEAKAKNESENKSN
jgi:predicted small secreted protein